MDQEHLINSLVADLTLTLDDLNVTLNDTSRIRWISTAKRSTFCTLEFDTYISLYFSDVRRFIDKNSTFALVIVKGRKQLGRCRQWII